MTTTISALDGQVSTPPDAAVAALDSAASTLKSAPIGDERETAILEEKIEEALGDAEDNWFHDSRNPRNWKAREKWIAVTIVSFYTFISPLGSSMMAPGLPEFAIRYKITSVTELSFTLSVFLLSFALAPLVIAPMSEMWGRTWILHIANLFFVAFNLGCAFAPTMSALIGLRFLAGAAGAAPIAIGSGTVSDLFAERDRASAMALYTVGPLIGPVIGPIIGGFVAQSIGIKYIFIIISCLGGFAAIVGIPFLRETYSPVLRFRIAAQAEDPEKVASKHPHPVAQQGSSMHLFWVNVSRPFVLLTRSFICFILSLYMALLYGYYYLMFTTFPELFGTVYGFEAGTSGLAYIGLGLGFLSATIFGAKIGSTIYQTLTDKNGGKGSPEMRIPALIFGSVFIPVGLLWYGWSAQAHVHWIMPIIGTTIFGFGMMTCFLPISLYLVDTFKFAASAVSAASVVRSLFGCVFPLFGGQMYRALGNGGGNSLLAGLAMVIGIPFPIWIYYKGADIRARSTLSR